jgi:hypothetical protein
MRFIAMTHLPGFQYEIFISYPREIRGWAREFYGHLKDTLYELTGAPKPRIFFDDNDWGGQDSLKLVEAARHSALFVAIVLPAYVPPEKFTRKELEAFCSAHEAQEVQEPPAIFDVEYYPTEDNDRPPQLRTPRRYKFWSEEGHVPVPLTLRRGSQEMYQLAMHIRNRLDQPPQAPLTPVGRYSGKAVLVGKVTNDLVHTRNELLDYFKGLGVTLLPETAYPKKWGPEFRAFFETQLTDGRPLMFVQLLSEVGSAKRDEEEESCAQFQCRAAVAHFEKAPVGTPNRVIVWRSVALDITSIKEQIDEDYDMPLLESAQAMGLEQLKKMIQQELDKMIQEELRTSIGVSKPHSLLPLVYITASKEDRENAEKLQEIAVNWKGAAKIMEDENPREDFEQIVGSAAVVIFLYGNANRSFVDGWLRTYFTEIKKKAQKQPIETIYRAPPQKALPAEKLNMNWHGLRKCGEYDAFKPECMVNILKELTKGNGECPRCGAT